MTPSRRRTDFAALVDEFVASLAPGGLVSLDADAADHAAVFRAKRQKLGRRVSVPDSPIAGIARRHGTVLATRNIRDFADSGLELIDPWQAVSP